MTKMTKMTKMPKMTKMTKMTKMLKMPKMTKMTNLLTAQESCHLSLWHEPCFKIYFSDFEHSREKRV